MDTEKLKQKILDLAIRGKLVPQDPNDEPAQELVKRIQEEKAKLVKEGKIKASKDESYIFKGSDNCYYEKIGNEINNIDNEIPYELPDSWAWVRLKTISKNISAGGDHPAIVSKLKTDECNIPIYSNGIDNNGLYGYTNQAKVFENGVTVSGRGTIGFSCVRNEPFVPIVRLITIIPFSLVSLDYLSLFFNASYEVGSGTSIPQLTVPMISKKLVAIPPINEQIKIAEIKKSADKYLSKISNIYENINLIVEKIKAKVLDSIFSETSSYKSYYEKKVPITDDAEILDYLRKPINTTERLERLSNATKTYPYYGATGQTGLIDDYLIDGEYVLLGEDGAPFLDKNSPKAYLINGKAWVNNHVHILKSKTNNKFLMYYLNWFNYYDYVTGTTRLKLNQKMLKKILIPDFSVESKEKIVSQISEAFYILESII